MFGSNHTDIGGNMDIDLIFKVGAIGIVVAVFNQILTKTGRDEQAMFVTLAGVIVVMALIVGMMNDLFMEVKSVFNLY
jgi:stage III sporulation protein AC